MAKVNRMRSDIVANPQSVKEYPVESGVQIELGDLCFYFDDGAGRRYLRPASHASLWESSENDTRRKLARKFAGVAVSSHDLNDTKITKVRVAGQGVAEYPVGTATTFVIGDLVSGDKDTGNTLLAQSVEKTSDPQEAIGKVTEQKTDSNVSLIHFAFNARVEAFDYENEYVEMEAAFAGAMANDTVPLTMVRQPGQVVEALFTAFTQMAAGADIKIDIQKADGTSLLSAAAILDRGVLTSAGVHVSLPLNATAANINVAEGESLKIVLTNSSGSQAADWAVKLRIKKNINR